MTLERRDLEPDGSCAAQAQKLGFLVAVSQESCFGLKPERALSVIQHIFLLVGFGFHPAGCTDTCD